MVAMSLCALAQAGCDSTQTTCTWAPKSITANSRLNLNSCKIENNPPLRLKTLALNNVCIEKTEINVTDLIIKDHNQFVGDRDKPINATSITISGDSNSFSNTYIDVTTLTIDGDSNTFGREAFKSFTTLTISGTKNTFNTQIPLTSIYICKSNVNYWSKATFNPYQQIHQLKGANNSQFYQNDEPIKNLKKKNFITTDPMPDLCKSP